MGKITKEEEKLFAEMKQLKKQIVPDAHLIEQTKKRVFDEDKVYHHTFLMIAIPTALILFHKNSLADIRENLRTSYAMKRLKMPFLRR